MLSGHDLVTFEVADEPEVVQRRGFVRVDTVQPVTVEPEAGDAPITTHALDISGGGMLLSGSERLELNATVRFSLKLHRPGQSRIEGTARVIRVDPGGRRGLAFEQIAVPERQRLVHFIFERQRATSAKGRLP